MAAETEEKYDPTTCVTAGELRAMGLKIPESIPDVGWLPTRAVLFGAPITKPGDDPNSIYVNLEVSFLEQFRWLTVTFTLEGEKK
jgi:hypothetical protein